MATNPPKMRPGKEYPGGRHMRRALRLLGQRQKGHLDGIAAMSRDHPGYENSVTSPGSMKA